MNVLSDFLPVLVFAVVAIIFTLIPVFIARLLAPTTLGEKTYVTYECGMPPWGSAWIRYTVTYFIYALIFLAFDVDILYLYPVALSYTKGSNIHEFYALLAFVVILVLAIIYAWGKGVFVWKRRV